MHADFVSRSAAARAYARLIFSSLTRHTVSLSNDTSFHFYQGHARALSPHIATNILYVLFC